MFHHAPLQNFARRDQSPATPLTRAKTHRQKFSLLLPHFHFFVTLSLNLRARRSTPPSNSRQNISSKFSSFPSHLRLPKKPKPDTKTTAKPKPTGGAHSTVPQTSFARRDQSSATPLIRAETPRQKFTSLLLPHFHFISTAP